MVEGDSAIEVENLRTSMATLRADRAEAEDRLTTTLRTIDVRTRELRNLEARIAADEKAQTTRHADRLELFETKKKQLETDLVNLTATLRERKDELKKATKELSKLNLFIATAKDQLEIARGKSKETEEELYALIARVDAQSRLLDDIATLESKRDALRLEVTQIEERLATSLAHHNTSLQRLRENTEALKRTSQDAADRKRQLDEEFDRKTEDLRIIVERIEAFWQKTFPELRMPL